MLGSTAHLSQVLVQPILRSSYMLPHWFVFIDYCILLRGRAVCQSATSSIFQVQEDLIFFLRIIQFLQLSILKADWALLQRQIRA